jgi:hypothetical protein
MMHPKNEGLFSSQVMSGGLKKSEPSPRGKIDSYPYLLSCIARIIFTLAYLLFCICFAFRRENKNCIVAL